jgi:hypothetical protein
MIANHGSFYDKYMRKPGSAKNKKKLFVEFLTGIVSASSNVMGRN